MDSGSFGYRLPDNKEQWVKKFGTFQGVFVPSFEAILGAVLFLILPGLVGNVGVVSMMIIIVLANTITLATSFSIADCTTNLHRIGAGGMYAIANRSLGKAFGGSIGIQLFLAQASCIGFYVLGFAKPLQPILATLPFYNQLLGGLTAAAQQQVIASLFALLAFVSAIVGADFVSKIQTAIFILLLVTVGAILASPFLNLQFQGQVLFSGEPNLWGNATGLVLLGGFWGAFTTFFPAVTGIDAGVGMSGKLADPRRSLGKGTFMAIGVTFVLYTLIALVFGFMKGEMLALKQAVGKQVVYPDLTLLFRENFFIYLIILLGILFAAGSSALSYFLTAPQTAQALARDRILPRRLLFLRSDFIKGGREPRWATLLTFLIVMGIVWSGDLSVAAMIVGICFLVVYGWINLAAFFERVSGNPSFRPTSRGHWAVSGYGFIACMTGISFLNIWIGIGVVVSQLAVFMLLLKYRARDRLEGVWWGVLFTWLNWGFRRLHRIIQGTKNWRPIVGVFCMADKKDESGTTLEMGKQIADFQGLTMINVLKPKKLKAPAFALPEGARLVEPPDDNYNAAILSILQAAVPGGFSLNTVLLPLDSRINDPDAIEWIINMDKHVLLYMHGKTSKHALNRVDVWWKGEQNGNFMALLAYILRKSDEQEGREPRTIRMIRKLSNEEDREGAQQEMEALLYSARLDGEILIVDDDGETIVQTVKMVSRDARLILMGMPGRKAEGISKFFSLDKLFFARELEKFEGLPPLLFVKAHHKVELFE